MPVFLYVGGKNPGSQTITATGAGTFVVPYYAENLRVRMHGAGAGGVGHNGTTGVNGAAGGNTTFDTLTAGGGGAPVTGSTPGAGGIASGGDTNENGQQGGQFVDTNDGGAAGGTSFGGGGFSGAPASNGPGINGQIYGGGGSGARTTGSGWQGGGGGAFVEKVYTPGTLAPGASVSYNNGAGGAGGNSTLFDGGNGANGRILIEWDY